MIRFLLPAACLLLNLYWTRRLLRSGAGKILIAGWLFMLWMLPFLGALLVWLQTRPPRRANQAASVKEARPAAPLQYDCGHQRWAWRDLLTVRDGMLMADLPKLRAAAQTLPPGKRAAAKLNAQRGWWLHLRDWLGGDFHVSENEDSLLLSPFSRAQREASLRSIDRARKAIRKLLPGLAQWPNDHKTLLLVLENEAQYHRYTAQYLPDEGVFATSSGMFIDGFYPHFVVVAGELSHIEPIIVHELTHASLAHLKLPRWLDEGIAVNTEWRLCPAASRAETGLPERHRAFWTAERMRAFWLGDAFLAPGEANTLSYDLARILVENLAREWTPFARFVHQAAVKGCGRAAAESLDVDLGRFAAAVVGHDYHAGWAPPR
ncbi:hypothetical protein [Chromobacterium sp. IIBBL 290-4]|uniref:hypothetical protein n=1 Tax=Chromobacterium sp. IIBBL 290-4 TaxID=2953890 RepID=UPI0020B8E2F7|nr:hypothetical protein [Chromobacterium sp. IIBBL 290-4]UTH72897.1 hypothetical protein NKT35_15290 [Chromobacterium sp. IIBBL 290-4]